jgi:cell division septum initiation protein DivIVA
MNDLADWSSERIRDEQFARRLRGFDEVEVREFQTGVADHIRRLRQHEAALRAQVEELKHSTDQQESRHQQSESALRAEIGRLTGIVENGETKERAVQLLNQAQTLADQLVSEAVQQTRDMMLATRAQIRELRLRSDGHATSISAPTAEPTGQATAGDADATYVQTYAGIAAIQLRAVVDALSDQIDKLGELADRPTNEPPGPASNNRNLRGYPGPGRPQPDTPRTLEAAE